MWTKIPAAIQPKTIDKLLKAARPVAAQQENRHFVRSGKTFFNKRLDLLKPVLVDLDRSLRLLERMSVPAINHAFLLFKSAGGPATKAHQDRAYWLDIEEQPTMFTAWIALADVAADAGAMRLNAANEVDLETFFQTSANCELLPHRQDQDGGGGFTTTLPEELATEVDRQLTTQPVSRGDVILFDAFEPHSATANSSGQARFAMKIVLGEGRSMNSYLATIQECQSVGCLYRLFPKRTGRNAA